MTPREGGGRVRNLTTAHELIVDSFAGGGGASLGISWALGRGPDVAINHDAEAIALHAANHPDTHHYCENVWKVDPREACAGRPVGLMWLSPDCKHFSKAKGGKPVNKKVRGLAWVAVRWAKAVRPRVVVLENVEEFQGWGPLLANGHPCPVRKGLTFRRFVGRLRALGYVVEWRELRACDYGAPTTRKRLFLVARCDGQPIVWPKSTHGKGRPKPWRTAAECIDWSLPCPSIFLTAAEAKTIGVKRPLAEATLRRIARGVQRYVLDAAEPFIVGVGGRMGQSAERAVDRPYQTITAKGDAALVVPTLINTRNGERDGQAPRVRDIAQPYATVTAKGSQGALVAAFLAKHYGGHETPGSQMTLPMDTVTVTDHHALVAAHVVKHYGGRVGSSLEEPLHTVTAESVHHGVVASSLVKLKGTSQDGQPTDAPLHTVQAGGLHYAEVRAFLIKYYGTDQDPRLELPLHAVTSRDRFGLVTVRGEQYTIADIGMRMLAPRELYRAQGFPDSYRIDIPFNGKPLSKTAQVRMCGNSVCPPLAEAIVRANYGAERIEVAA